jgi:hypothetical protein
MMMSQLPYGGGATVGLFPVNLATAANNAAWVSTRNINEYMAIMFFSGVGAANEDPVLSLEQADDALGTNAVVLGLKRVYYKVGTLATLGLLTAAVDQWVQDTAVTTEIPAATYSTAGIDGGCVGVGSSFRHACWKAVHSIEDR